MFTKVKTVKEILLFLVLFLFIGCQTVKNIPQEPTIDESANELEKADAYKEHCLYLSGNAFSGYYFTQGTKPILLNIISVGDFIKKATPEGGKEFQKGYNNAMLASGFASAGGGLIGYTLGYMLGSQRFPEFGPYTLLGGAGSIALSYLFSNNAGKHFDNAVEVYNDSLKTILGISKKEQLSLSLLPIPMFYNDDNGIALYLNLVKISY